MNEVKDFENAINVKCRCCTWNGWVPETQFGCPNCNEIDTFDIFAHNKIPTHMITRSETMTQEDLYRFTDIGKKIEIFGSKFDLTTVHDLEGKHVIWTNGIIDVRVDICPRNGYEELENMDGIVIGISERNYGYMDLEQFVKKKPTNYLEFATICKNSIQKLLKSTCPGFVGNGVITICPTDQITPDTEIIHILAYHNGQIILSDGTIINHQKTKK